MTNGNMNHTTAPRHRNLRGFTLVELLMVIVIIGILLGIAVPAIMGAISRGNATEMRMEIGAIEQAIERYHDKYGDYPPDFSSWTVVERHYRKIFPRIGAAELERLQLLTDTNPGNDKVRDLNTVTPAAHDPTALDRGEVLHWVLGGYSSNPLTPFTGPGGPLDDTEDPNIGPNEIVFQINIDRDNSFYEFEPTRLDLSTIDAGSSVGENNRYESSDGDLFASYAVHDNDDVGPPFVYFDSRTYALYDATLADFNGYGSTAFGVIRPYYSNLSVANKGGNDYADLPAALRAWKFMNPDKYQIISPGLDGRFGSFASIAFDPSTNVTANGEEPLYFQYPTGLAIAPSKASGVNTPGDLLVPGIRAFQESSKFGGSDDFQADNITNFSKVAIIDDLEEE